MTVPGVWLPLTGLSWIPYAFGSVCFVASPSFLGTIPQAYLLLMGLTVRCVCWQFVCVLEREKVETSNQAEANFLETHVHETVKPGHH